MAVVQQPTAEVPADEAAAAGDEDFKRSAQSSLADRPRR